MRKTIICMLVILVLSAPAFALDPGTFDIIIYANEDYRLNLTHTANGQPTNLAGCQFRLQARENAAAPVFLTFSSAVIDAAAGKTRHWLTRRATAANVNTAGVYDLMQIASDGTITYRMKGTYRVLETITR